MKKTVSILLALIMVLSFAGCGKTDSQQTIKEENTVIRLATLKGPTGMGMVKMISDDENAENHKYEVTLSSAPDDIKAGIINGSYDIAAIPTNLAAVLYNKGGADISVLAVNTLGVLYVLENGDSIKTINDLKGKKIYTTGQASTPEYIFDYILKCNNIDPDKDVDIEYLTEHSELSTQIASDSVQIGVLPEPNVTTSLLNSQSGKLRIALNLTEEWEKSAPDTTIMQGCIVVSNTFLENYPEKVKEFMKEYESSVNYVNSNIKDASVLCEKTGIVPKAAVAEKAIPNCNIVFVAGEEMKKKLNSFFEVLFKADPSSVGGKLPDDNFYYLEK